ncbi:MAG: flagellar assembly protein FliX [Hyphomicrobiaceae bacterium]|nr:flagellar assembly protein FliX [Hyphomicrobiaceae bacterium]MCC0024789.1 flagellar assembly protein FliX [Hyphomicrobiaceae bacterium]
MRIEGPSNRYPVKTRRTSSSANGASFLPDEGNEPAHAEAAQLAPGVGALDSILALQAVEDPLLAKKRAVKHGQSLLDVLDEIKADLLVGRIGEGRINRLLALISRARELSDPALEAVITDIELRARVELAKLGH